MKKNQIRKIREQISDITEMPVRRLFGETAAEDAERVNRLNSRFFRKVFREGGNGRCDAINHPRHYNIGKIEVIAFIEDQKLGMHTGNAVKYICRAGRKSRATRVEDLEKAVWYLKRKIELLKAKAAKRAPVAPNDMEKESDSYTFTRTGGTKGDLWERQ